MNINETVESIHEAALELLDNPGVRMEHEKIVALLLKNGAKTGDGADVIRFPRELVEEALSRCPRDVLFADRRGKGRTVSPDGEPQVWSVPGMYLWKDRCRRPFTAENMAGMSRLFDQLENVDGVFGMSLSDVPPTQRDVTGLRIIAENTGKHIRVLCFTPEGADCLVRMRAAVADTPWFSIGFTAHGPLRWTNLALDTFYRTAGHGIPASINGEPMAGVSGPVTLAGAAAVGHAEILAAIVVNQLLEPGRPCTYNLGLAHTFDMRTSIAVTGGPENALYAAMSAALGRRCGIPSVSWVSTESMSCDAQAGMEKMFGFQTHIAAGVSNIWGVGQLESELTLSPAMAVIDNEMLGFVKRYRRGVSADTDSLAVELTREVGIGGSYLAEEHTLENFRSELYIPNIICRRKREIWEEQGGKDLEAAAEERALALMENETESALTDEQRKNLRELETDFAKRQGEKK